MPLVGETTSDLLSIRRAHQVKLLELAAQVLPKHMGVNDLSAGYFILDGMDGNLVIGNHSKSSSEQIPVNGRVTAGQRGALRNVQMKPRPGPAHYLGLIRGPSSSKQAHRLMSSSLVC